MGRVSDRIHVQGAREHNLRDVSLDLPREEMIVFTGLSGSGKSSLAFDTIFAEGQRRYVESLSAYARQFIGQMEQDYHMDAVLRVKNCLYAHYTGPMPESQLASYKLQVHAFENEQKLTGTSYTIYVNQDEDDAVVDVFMETK